MTVLYNILRSLSRRKKKSLAVFITVLVLSLALMLFGGSVEQMRDRLRTLEKESDIQVVISNITGNRTAGLFIREKRVTPLLESSLLVPEELRASAVFSPKQMTDDSMVIYSWNGFWRADATLTPVEKQVSYIDGMDGTILAGSEPVCLLDETYMEKEGLSLGDSFEIYLYTLTSSRKGLATVHYSMPLSLQVVGSIPSSQAMEPGNTAMVLPYGTLKAAIEESGRAFATTVARFRVKDAADLPQIKALLEQAELMETQQSTSSFGGHGDRAIVTDSTYITTAEPMMRNIRVMESFYPLITLVVALTGLLVSGLTVRDRRYETAIQLSLGTPRHVIFASLAGELLILTLLAVVLAAVGTALFAGAALSALLPQAGLLVGAYLMGSILWILLQTFLSPAALLRQND